MFTDFPVVHGHEFSPLFLRIALRSYGFQHYPNKICFRIEIFSSETDLQLYRSDHLELTLRYRYEKQSCFICSMINSAIIEDN